MNDILSDGPKSVKYTQLVEWLSKELGSLCALDDHVNAIASPDDSSAFMLELSGFLKEIGLFKQIKMQYHYFSFLSLLKLIRNGKRT